jgi:hypothetical protein
MHDGTDNHENSGKVAKLQSCMWSSLPLCNLATLLFSQHAPVSTSGQNDDQHHSKRKQARTGDVVEFRDDDHAADDNRQAHKMVDSY